MAGCGDLTKVHRRPHVVWKERYRSEYLDELCCHAAMRGMEIIGFKSNVQIVWLVERGMVHAHWSIVAKIVVDGNIG